MAGTQLYNKDKSMIFPNTKATNVDMVNTTYSGRNTEDCIIDLYNKFGQLSGADEQKNQIEITVDYTLSTEKTKGDWLVQISWSSDFQLPTSSNPYAWKLTQFMFDENDPNPKIFYEIVAADIAEKTQTIYFATNNTTTPKIEYPMVEDKKDTNEIQKDTFVPDGWSKDPISISATQPNVFMATRVKKEGIWEDFSDVVQFGKWAYDSIIVLKYATTGLNDNAPDVNRDNTEPGNDWKDIVDIDSNNFTGKIWQISATSVNGVLTLADNKIWSGPNLISIIK